MGKNLSAIDFFCGAGGMTYGLSEAGIDVLAGIDVESKFKDTYTINNKNSKFINWDITQKEPYQLKEQVDINKNDDSMIFVGCSPCQYWSKVNTDRFSSSLTKNLLYDFMKFIKYYKPGYILIENVPGIKNKKNNYVLQDFYEFLNLNGYEHDSKIINANNYGVPQTRRRFVLLATRCLDNIELPKGNKRNDLTVRKFLGQENGFDPIPAGHKDKSEFIHTSSNLSDINIKRIQNTKKDGGTRMEWKDDPELQVKGYIGKDNQFKNVYSRMFWDKPAPTITTRFNSYSNGRFGHPEENRAISLREGATLQTFPKNYKFRGTINSIAKQIGNAVPPKLAQILGEHLLKQGNICHTSEQKQEQLTS